MGAWGAYGSDEDGDYSLIDLEKENRRLRNEYEQRRRIAREIERLEQENAELRRELGSGND